MSWLVKLRVPTRALPHLPEVTHGRHIPCLSSGPTFGADVVMTRWKKGHYLSGRMVPSGEDLLASVQKEESTEEVGIVVCQSSLSFAEHVSKRLGITVADYLLSCVGYNLWNGEGCKPLAPAAKRETAFSRFEAALKEDHRREQVAARESAKLEPLTIVISDQQELKRIYALASAKKANPIPFVRRHLRVWSRDEFTTLQLETSVA